MIDLPFDDLTDPIRLADWLELYALTSPDHNSSRGDLDGALRRAALAELEDDEAIEVKIMEVFDELEERMRITQMAYPFEMDHPGVLALKSTWEYFPTYVFCLCLSYLPIRETKGPRLFERVSCLAAGGYLQGEAVGFGFPRKELPSAFSDAVTELCGRIGEGMRYKNQLALDRQDDTLDLVAWKDFVDGRPSKVLMFGQCGAGQNWTQKLGELDPKQFWDQWMHESLVSPIPVKSFFSPYRIQPERWEFYARKAGILFDRCRIAFCAQKKMGDYSEIIAWVTDFLMRSMQ